MSIIYRIFLQSYKSPFQVEKLIEKLDERKAQAEKSFSVKRLEKKICGLPCSLIAPQRYIVSEEKLRELVSPSVCLSIFLSVFKFN